MLGWVGGKAGGFWRNRSSLKENMWLINGKLCGGV